jgi:hypothetical protein
MNLLMFNVLTCLSFFRISFSWIPIVIDVFSDRLQSFSKLPEYRYRIHFQQYRINFVFKKKYENKSDLAFYESFPIVFIQVCQCVVCTRHKAGRPPLLTTLSVGAKQLTLRLVVGTRTPHVTTNILLVLPKKQVTHH